MSNLPASHPTTKHPRFFRLAALLHRQSYRVDDLSPCHGSQLVAPKPNSKIVICPERGEAYRRAA